MSEFKGTKGKWVIHRETMIVTEEEQIGDVICLMPQSKESQANWINNALLISKAPEMLEELIKEVEILKSIGLGDTERCKRKEQLIKQATEL